MMGASYRQQLADEAAERAEQEGVEPWQPETADEVSDAFAGKRAPVPFLGDYVPDGWEPEGEPLFVDTSGFGSASEPALTTEETEAAMAAGVERGLGWALVEVGQFQAYLQAYRRVDG